MDQLRDLETQMKLVRFEDIRNEFRYWEDAINFEIKTFVESLRRDFVEQFNLPINASLIDEKFVSSIILENQLIQDDEEKLRNISGANTFKELFKKFIKLPDPKLTNSSFPRLSFEDELRGFYFSASNQFIASDLFPTTFKLKMLFLAFCSFYTGSFNETSFHLKRFLSLSKPSENLFHLGNLLSEISEKQTFTTRNKKVLIVVAKDFNEDNTDNLYIKQIIPVSDYTYPNINIEVKFSLEFQNKEECLKYACSFDHCFFGGHGSDENGFNFINLDGSSGTIVAQDLYNSSVFDYCECVAFFSCAVEPFMTLFSRNAQKNSTYIVIAKKSNFQLFEMFMKSYLLVYSKSLNIQTSLYCAELTFLFRNLELGSLEIFPHKKHL